MKNKMILSAIAAAALTVYLVARKKTTKKSMSPEQIPDKKMFNHMTDVFSRAKAHIG
ncbi:MAG: hypothetical protein ABJA78_12855 [Ferruginibacter sp.]